MRHLRQAAGFYTKTTVFLWCSAATVTASIPVDICWDRSCWWWSLRNDLPTLVGFSMVGSLVILRVVLMPEAHSCAAPWFLKAHASVAVIGWHDIHKTQAILGLVSWWSKSTGPLGVTFKDAGNMITALSQERFHRWGVSEIYLFRLQHIRRCYSNWCVNKDELPPHQQRHAGEMTSNMLLIGAIVGSMLLSMPTLASEVCTKVIRGKVIASSECQVGRDANNQLNSIRTGTETR